MHLIRRSALRTITSPSASFLSKTRSIATSSPFITRTKPQATLSPIFRRFASNNGETEAHESNAESPSSSADSEDQSSIASAISSVTESVSTYASDAKDAAVNTVSGIAAAGRAYAPSDAGDNYRNNSSSEPFARRSFGRDSAALQPAKSLYVGNLLFETSEEDLLREFGEFGNITSVKIARDPRNLSKGFGYVHFDTLEAATAAIEAKNQSILDGRRIAVNYQLKPTRSFGGVNPPGKTLFIGNLAFEMTDADLNKLFRDIKNVMDVRVAIDRRTGQPRGFAHADFVDIESASKGLEFLQGKEFYGRVLRVDYAGNTRRADSPPQEQY